MNKIILHTHSVWSWEEGAEFQAPRKEAWEWFRPSTEQGDVHIFEDLLLPEHSKYDCRLKIAAIYECPEIYKFNVQCNPTVFNPFEWIKDNYQHFDYILSPYFELQRTIPKPFLWVPALSSRVKREEFGLYEKSRNISIIASFKDWTYGHKLRHTVIKQYNSFFDVYGSGYNNIINTHGKLLTIAPYRFSICILNSIEEDYFTEALTDLLAVGTIPVIFGTKAIAKYWNPDGLIFFETAEELGRILPTLTPELYQSKLAAVEENIQITKNYISIPDYIYEHYKQILETL